MKWRGGPVELVPLVDYRVPVHRPSWRQYLGAWERHGDVSLAVLFWLTLALTWIGFQILYALGLAGR